MLNVKYKNIVLSDDEIAILRHICLKRYDRIGRKFGGALYLGCTGSYIIDSTFEDFFEGVFEWINELEEYEIEKLLKIQKEDKRNGKRKSKVV